VSSISLKTSDFDYQLPEALIAQHPCGQRDASRLLVLGRNSGQISHFQFSELSRFLRPGDRLVFNNTRVFPARLMVHKDTGAVIELLFTSKVNDLVWNAIARNARRLKPGSQLFIDRNPAISLEIVAMHEDGSRKVALRPNQTCATISALLERYGEVPLPPYIHRPVAAEDRAKYQTVYAEKEGAVAAPTAGLHFTPELMAGLKAAGIDQSFVTLHVGIGTFRPVKEEDPRNHVMHSEVYELSAEAAEAIHATRRQGGRIFAVGTTVVRVLEHCAGGRDFLTPGSGQTTLKILPGYEYRIVDGIVTNFHLPCSTLLMLISAFAGRQKVLAAYAEAVEKRYRFFSYGDAMLIL
jgi:S-adenosylmethionine:tRNA ribosyltransferase-isomerase